MKYGAISIKYTSLANIKTKHLQNMLYLMSLCFHCVTTLT